MAPTRKRKNLEAKTDDKRPKLDSSGLKEQLKQNEPAHSSLILSTVLNAKKQTQQNLRQQIRKLRQDLEYTRKFRQNPLELFPQEIWELILSNVDDVNDLANCSRVCTLFKAIINSSDQELLFGKVFPILLHYLYESGIQRYKIKWAAAGFGSVCRKWRSSFNNLADVFYRVDQPISQPLERLQRGQEIHFDDKRFLSFAKYYILAEQQDGNEEIEDEENIFDEEDDEESIADEKKLIERKPFLSDIAIQLNSESTNLSNLDIYGRSAWQLSLKIKNDNLSTQQLYLLCAKSLEKCGNLKSFCVLDWDYMQSFTTEFVQNGIDNAFELEPSPRLESLTISVRTDDFLPVQNGLVQHLCPQLKKLDLWHWDSELYPTLLWSHLTELQILDRKCIEVLESLTRMTSTLKLYKLSVRLDRTCQNLASLFNAINQFSSLGHLRLLLSNEFEAWKQENIMNVPLDLLTSNGITTLELVSRELDMSRNLPVLFPLIRNLTLRCGDEAVKFFDDNHRNSKTNKKMFSKQSYFIEMDKDMYKSKIWKLFPRLQTLKMQCPSDSESWTYGDKDKTFTREAYLWPTEKYAAAAQLHLNKVQDFVQIVERERVRFELDNISEMARENGKKNRLRKYAETGECKQGNSLHEKILLFILPHLAKSDIPACRLVCKVWTSLVGNCHMKNCQHDVLYKFETPLATNSQLSEFEAYLQNNLSKPFFARKVQIRLTEQAGNAAGIIVLLKSLGNYAHHLTITAEKGIVPRIAEIYRICVECMNHCSNLRSFSLQVPMITDGTLQEYKKLKKSQKLVPPRNLKSLSTSGPHRGEHKTALNRIVNDLEEACQNSLEILEQDCTKVGSNYPNLRELIVKNFDNTKEDWEDRWIWCSAPNLEKLSLFITGKHVIMDDFWMIACKYPKLKLLQLQFSSACSGLKGNLIDCTPNYICNVPAVHIAFRNKNQASLDFLVHFPFVKNLRIMYGKYVTLLSEEESCGANEREDPEQDLPVRHPEKDFIELVKYLKDENAKEHDSTAIYTSNVWTVLRKLQTIEIFYSGEDKNLEETIFQRK